MKRIAFVTSNPGKYNEAKAVLSAYCDLDQLDLEITEIQGTIEEIVKDKARKAYEVYKKPLFVEDVSVHYPALGGFPGPYIKDFLRKMSLLELVQVMEKLGDTSMIAKSTIGYITDPETIHIFEGECEGCVVEPKEDHFFSKLSWNAIFKPKGHDKTFGQLAIEEQSKISHRYYSICKLKEYLKVVESI